MNHDSIFARSWQALKNLTPNPSLGTLTPGADAVPSPAERERVIWYLGDIEGKGNKSVST